MNLWRAHLYSGFAALYIASVLQIEDSLGHILGVLLPKTVAIPLLRQKVLSRPRRARKWGRLSRERQWQQAWSSCYITSIEGVFEIHLKYYRTIRHTLMCQGPSDTHSSDVASLHQFFFFLTRKQKSCVKRFFVIFFFSRTEATLLVDFCVICRKVTRISLNFWSTRNWIFSSTGFYFHVKFLDR